MIVSHDFPRPTSATPAVRQPAVWLVKDGEPLPVDPAPHLLRTGSLANRLADDGLNVTWWSSRFDHGRKQVRANFSGVVRLRPNYSLVLLDGPPYKRNLSLARIRNYRSIATQFTRMARDVPPPDLILASYPSPELCGAARRFAKQNHVPFVIDVRDPYPDHVAGFFGAALQPLLFPALLYYRRAFRSILADSDGIVSVSEAMLDWAMTYAGRPRRSQDRVIRIGGSLPSNPRTIDVPEQFTTSSPLVCVLLSPGGSTSDAMSVVQAARLLERQGEHRVRFVITGGGESNSAWRQAVRGLRSVTCTGWLSRDEMDLVLGRAHVGLIQMSGGVVRFWLGNKFYDYLAYFLTVINTVPGEAATIVRERDLGTNIHPKDPAALATAIRNLISSPSRVRSHMENSRSAFLADFEREKIQEEYAAYLRRHLGGWTA